MVTGEFGSSSNISLFQNISCPTIVGTSTLASCTVNPVASNCYPYCPGANIGIRCFSKSPCCLIKSSLTALSLSISDSTGCTDGALRFADGIIENEGRIEVCYDGVWGTICDDGWDTTDAHVVCQQMGHPELGMKQQIVLFSLNSIPTHLRIIIHLKSFIYSRTYCLHWFSFW